MVKRETVYDFAERCLHIIAGTILIAISINMFFKPNNIVVGGVSGLGILMENLWGIKVSVVNVAFNIPLLFVALKFMGKGYVAGTVAATMLFSAMLEALNFVPQIKGDFLLASVFGGIIDGIGIGLVLKGRGSTGGVDLISVLVHKVKREIPVSIIMLAINSAIIAAGMFVFGINKGMYAIITVFISSKVRNMVTSGLVISKMAVIVSDKSDIIAWEIMQNLHRGVTFLDGKGAYTGSEKNVLLCVFSQKETVALADIVKKNDPKSFIIIIDARLVLGSGFKNIEKDDIF